MKLWTFPCVFFLLLIVFTQPTLSFHPEDLQIQQYSPRKIQHPQFHPLKCAPVHLEAIGDSLSFSQRWQFVSWIEYIILMSENQESSSLLSSESVWKTLPLPRKIRPWRIQLYHYFLDVKHHSHAYGFTLEDYQHFLIDGKSGFPVPNVYIPLHHVSSSWLFFVSMVGIGVNSWFHVLQGQFRRNQAIFRHLELLHLMFIGSVVIAFLFKFQTNRYAEPCILIVLSFINHLCLHTTRHIEPSILWKIFDHRYRPQVLQFLIFSSQLILLSFQSYVGQGIQLTTGLILTFYLKYWDFRLENNDHTTAHLIVFIPYIILGILSTSLRSLGIIESSIPQFWFLNPIKPQIIFPGLYIYEQFCYTFILPIALAFFIFWSSWSNVVTSISFRNHIAKPIKPSRNKSDYYSQPPPMLHLCKRAEFLNEAPKPWLNHEQNEKERTKKRHIFRKFQIEQLKSINDDPQRQMDKYHLSMHIYTRVWNAFFKRNLIMFSVCSVFYIFSYLIVDSPVLESFISIFYPLGLAFFGFLNRKILNKRYRAVVLVLVAALSFVFWEVLLSNWIFPYTIEPRMVFRSLKRFHL